MGSLRIWKVLGYLCPSRGQAETLLSFDNKYVRSKEYLKVDRILTNGQSKYTSGYFCFCLTSISACF